MFDFFLLGSNNNSRVQKIDGVPMSLERALQTDSILTAEVLKSGFPSQFACQKVQPYDGCYYSVTSRDQACLAAKAESII